MLEVVRRPFALNPPHLRAQIYPATSPNLLRGCPKDSIEFLRLSNNSPINTTAFHKELEPLLDPVAIELGFSLGTIRYLLSCEKQQNAFALGPNFVAFTQSLFDGPSPVFEYIDDIVAVAWHELHHLKRDRRYGVKGYAGVGEEFWADSWSLESLHRLGYDIERTLIVGERLWGKSSGTLQHPHHETRRAALKTQIATCRENEGTPHYVTDARRIEIILPKIRTLASLAVHNSYLTNLNISKPVELIRRAKLSNETRLSDLEERFKTNPRDDISLIDQSADALLSKSRLTAQEKVRLYISLCKSTGDASVRALGRIKYLSGSLKSVVDACSQDNQMFLEKACANLLGIVRKEELAHSVPGRMLLFMCDLPGFSLPPVSQMTHLERDLRSNQVSIIRRPDDTYVVPWKELRDLVSVKPEYAFVGLLLGLDSDPLFFDSLPPKNGLVKKLFKGRNPKDSDEQYLSRSVNSGLLKSRLYHHGAGHFPTLVCRPTGLLDLDLRLFRSGKHEPFDNFYSTRDTFIEKDGTVTLVAPWGTMANCEKGQVCGATLPKDHYNAPQRLVNRWAEEQLTAGVNDENILSVVEELATRRRVKNSEGSIFIASTLLKTDLPRFLRLNEKLLGTFEGAAACVRQIFSNSETPPSVVRSFFGIRRDLFTKCIPMDEVGWQLKETVNSRKSDLAVSSSQAFRRNPYALFVLKNPRNIFSHTEQACILHLAFDNVNVVGEVDKGEFDQVMLMGDFVAYGKCRPMIELILASGNPLIKEICSQILPLEQACRYLQDLDTLAHERKKEIKLATRVRNLVGRRAATSVDEETEETFNSLDLIQSMRISAQIYSSVNELSSKPCGPEIAISMAELLSSSGNTEPHELLAGNPHLTKNTLRWILKKNALTDACGWARKSDLVGITSADTHKSLVKRLAERVDPNQEYARTDILIFLRTLTGYFPDIDSKLKGLYINSIIKEFGLDGRGKNLLHISDLLVNELSKKVQLLPRLELSVPKSLQRSIRKGLAEQINAQHPLATSLKGDTKNPKRRALVATRVVAPYLDALLQDTISDPRKCGMLLEFLLSPGSTKDTAIFNSYYISHKKKFRFCRVEQSRRDLVMQHRQFWTQPARLRIASSAQLLHKPTITDSAGKTISSTDFCIDRAIDPASSSFDNTLARTVAHSLIQKAADYQRPFLLAGLLVGAANASAKGNLAKSTRIVIQELDLFFQKIGQNVPSLPGISKVWADEFEELCGRNPKPARWSVTQDIDHRRLELESQIGAITHIGRTLGVGSLCVATQLDCDSGSVVFHKQKPNAIPRCTDQYNLVRATFLEVQQTFANESKQVLQLAEDAYLRTRRELDCTLAKRQYEMVAEAYANMTFREGSCEIKFRVPKVLASGEDYYVTEYMPGETLDTYFEGPAKQHEARLLSRAIIQSSVYLLARGYWESDRNPANFKFDPTTNTLAVLDAKAALTDKHSNFVLAKLGESLRKSLSYKDGGYPRLQGGNDTAHAEARLLFASLGRYMRRLSEQELYDSVKRGVQQAGMTPVTRAWLGTPVALWNEAKRKFFA